MATEVMLKVSQHAARVTAMCLAGTSHTSTCQLLAASLTKPWSDIYLVTCGWIEQIPKSPSSMRDELVYGPMMTGTFMGMGVTEFLERKREMTESLQSPRGQEPRLFIDFFSRDFREHLRIETDLFDYGQLDIQSSPDSRASARALSQIIVASVDAACVTPGVLSVARGVPRPEKHLTFASELTFDEYNSWRIELKRRSS